MTTPRRLRRPQPKRRWLTTAERLDDWMNSLPAHWKASKTLRAYQAAWADRRRGT